MRVHPGSGITVAAGAGATLMALGLAATPAAAQDAGVLDAARSHLFAGRYDEARATLRPAVRQGGSDAARVLHARILAEQGAYGDALETVGGSDGAGTGGGAGTARIRGEILLAVGRWDEAAAAFRESVDGGAPDAEVARLHLAELDFMQGERDEAMAVFDGFIDLYNDRRGELSGEELLAVARAVTYLGRQTAELFQDALRAYDEAAERLPGDPRPLVAIGDLFLSRYTSTDAYDEYARVLERNPRHPEALHGRARALDFDGSGEALTVAQQVLEVNPNHVGAHVLSARVHLRSQALDRAREAVDAALEVNPNSLEALAVLAAIHHQTGDRAAFDRTVARSDALNPVHPGLHVTLAKLAADTRKYADAVRFAAEAVRRDPESWEAVGTLATNQLRTGELARGRTNMEAAFAGDPYNPWYKNTLDLLDKIDRFQVVETEHFQIALPPDDAELLAPYVTRIAEESYAALVERYGAEPPLPIRLELFPSSEDFSVRTLGERGLGALGVSFGSTLVMDAPSARTAGDFNWASTLWHELAHAFHLGISDHNVPRWFSEGLAVREQRVAEPRWGFRASPAFLQRWADGDMPPLSRMDEGFMRPKFPQQVPFSYLQASLAFDWIEEEYGFQVVRDFLDGYREGKGTGQLSRELLGMDEDALDEAFETYMEERFEGELAAVVALPSPMTSAFGAGGRDHSDEPTLEEMLVGGGAGDLDALRAGVRAQPGSFPARLVLGQALVATGEPANYDEAEEHLREALRLFPSYGGPNGPLPLLARIHEARGEIRQAADALRRAGTFDENGYALYVKEAELRRELNQPTEEKAALEKAVEVFPYASDLHERLAELAREAGDTEREVLALRSILALDPVDRAQAHYRLADALVRAGEPREARTQLLRALEIAPTYEPALELLLELRGGGGSDTTPAGRRAP